jgi:hypothetical protein
MGAPEDTAMRRFGAAARHEANFRKRPDVQARPKFPINHLGIC